MKRLSLLFVLISFLGISSLVMTSCEKRVTPHKVERIITHDSWKITEFTFQDNDITELYAAVTVGFGEEGSLTFLNSGNVTGKWSVSSGKKPTILYVTSIMVEPYYNFADNWEVLTCSKSKITMKADHGSYTNTVTLTKVTN